MRFKSLLLCVAACVLHTSVASAGLITNVTSSNGAIASVTVNQAPTIGNGKVLDMTVTLFQRNVPFDLVFTAPGGAPANNSYTVNMTVVNQIVGGGNGYINGFDLKNLIGPAFVTPGWSGLLTTVTPTSPDFALQMVNGPNQYNIPTGWRFGGINGGGNPIYNGESAFVSFVYQQKTSNDPLAGNGTTRLQFTANPEPGTLLLASLAGVPAFVAMRRRRNQKAASAASC
ncbi:MAG: hypothetical protein JNL58_12265 [Planctomyces sp.]|nr:hypothetical protein [Planctomyces sp.]